MNRIIISIFFYWPFVCSCLNIQNVISKFISDSIAQKIAYANLGLLLLGPFLIKNYDKNRSKTARLWFIFYFLFYGFGLLAIGLFGYQTSIIASLIPLFYVVGFYFFFSNKAFFRLSFKVIAISFVISSIFTIIFHHLNFSMDIGGVNEWEIDRAGGLYGDANNAALANIIAFLFFNRMFNPQSKLQKTFKIFILLVLFYSIFITFSTTGLFVFTIVFFITHYKYFSGIRFVLLILTIVLLYAGIFAIQSETKSLGLSEAQTAKIDNIINVLTFNIEKVNNSGRADLFQNILFYLKKSPIVGNGINFSVAMRAHNTYIGIWVDAGIITFLFFLTMLGINMFKSFFLEQKIKYFAVSVLTVLYIFMISLQTVINQPYLIVVFIFIAYLIDYNELKSHKTVIV